jgi:hypothetical protein
MATLHIPLKVPLVTHTPIPDVPFPNMNTVYKYIKMFEAKRSISDSNRTYRRYMLKNWMKLVLDKGQLPEDQ